MRKFLKNMEFCVKTRVFLEKAVFLKTGVFCLHTVCIKRVKQSLTVRCPFEFY